MNVSPLCIGCLTSNPNENNIQTTCSTENWFSHNMIHGRRILDRRSLYIYCSNLGTRDRTRCKVQPCNGMFKLNLSSPTN